MWEWEEQKSSYFVAEQDGLLLGQLSHIIHQELHV